MNSSRPGTYSHPDRGTPFDERSSEFGEEGRKRIRSGLKNSNGSSREGR